MSSEKMPLWTGKLHIHDVSRHLCKRACAFYTMGSTEMYHYVNLEGSVVDEFKRHFPELVDDLLMTRKGEPRSTEFNLAHLVAVRYFTRMYQQLAHIRERCQNGKDSGKVSSKHKQSSLTGLQFAKVVIEQLEVSGKDFPVPMKDKHTSEVSGKDFPIPVKDKQSAELALQQGNLTMLEMTEGKTSSASQREEHSKELEETLGNIDAMLTASSLFEDARINSAIARRMGNSSDRSREETLPHEKIQEISQNGSSRSLRNLAPVLFVETSSSCKGEGDQQLLASEFRPDQAGVCVSCACDNKDKLPR